MFDKEKQVTCPDCWAEQTIDDDYDKITCEECGYEFYDEENVGDSDEKIQ